MNYFGVTDHVPLVELSTESSQQSTAIEDTNKAINRCLDYLLTFPNGTITYITSDMVLWVHSDDAYLVEDGANSRAGGH